MKPSERIKEIEKELHKNESYPASYFHALEDYLDEQYEKNKLCEHKNIEDFKGLDSCKDCGVVGWLKD